MIQVVSIGFGNIGCRLQFQVNLILQLWDRVTDVRPFMVGVFERYVLCDDSRFINWLATEMVSEIRKQYWPFKNGSIEKECDAIRGYYDLAFNHEMHFDVWQWLLDCNKYLLVINCNYSSTYKFLQQIEIMILAYLSSSYQRGCEMCFLLCLA